MNQAKNNKEQPIQWVVKLYALLVLFSLFIGLTLFLNLTPTWLNIIEIISINLTMLLSLTGLLLIILVLKAKLNKKVILSVIFVTIIAFLLFFCVALTLDEKKFAHHLTLKNNQEIAVYEVWDFLDGFRRSEIMMQMGLLPVMRKITSVPFMVKNITTHEDFVILQLDDSDKLPNQDEIYININSQEYFYK